MKYDPFFKKALKEGSFDSKNTYKQFSNLVDPFTKVVDELSDRLQDREFWDFLDSIPLAKRRDFQDRLAILLGSMDKLDKVNKKTLKFHK
jgi:hypothetical protein